MAVKTQALAPFNPTSIPDRLTPLYVADKTKVTTTAGTGAVQRLGRLQSASFGESVPITEVSEMGAVNRVGGVDMLGEAKIQLAFNEVSIDNLAAITGTPVLSGAGQTTNIGITQFQAAQADIIRLAADAQNNVFGTLYLQDCIVNDYTFDVKSSGVASGQVSGMGPNATFFPGFIIPKAYVVQAADVTNGYINLASVLGADEAPVQIFLPLGISAPTISGVTATTGGTILAGSYKYIVTALNGVGETGQSNEITIVTTGSTSANTISWAAVPGATGYNVYRTAVGGATGTELKIASNVQAVSFVDTAPGSPAGAFPGTNGTATTNAPPSYWQQNGAVYFLKIEKVPQANLTAATTRYYEANTPNGKTATFTPWNNHLAVSDTLVAGDVFRLTFCSYNTNSLPLTVPNSSPATTRAGIAARSVIVNVNAGQIKRIQSTQIKFSFKKEHVNGVGEPSIIYGPASIPDVAITFDLKEYDNRVLSALSTGSANMSDAGGTIRNDFQELGYATRFELNPANALPFSVAVNDPFSAATLLTLSCPQFVVKDIDYGSTNKADNTIKVNAMDIQGALTISYTHP